MIDPPTHSSFNPSTHSLTNQPIYSPTNPLIHPPTHSVILHSYNDPQLSYPNIQQSILPSPRTYPFIHGQTKPGHITLIWSTMWHIHSPNHTMCLWYRSTALTQTSVPVFLGLTHSSPPPTDQLICFSLRLLHRLFHMTPTTTNWIKFLCLQRQQLTTTPANGGMRETPSRPFHDAHTCTQRRTEAPAGDDGHPAPKSTQSPLLSQPQ